MPDSLQVHIKKRLAIWDKEERTQQRMLPPGEVRLALKECQPCLRPWLAIKVRRDTPVHLLTE